jgi:hypothetical protein
MDPITIIGISLASVVAIEALLTKIYIIVKTRNRSRLQEIASSPVSDTT